MVSRFNRVPAFREVYAKADRGPRKLDPVAGNQTQVQPGELVSQGQGFRAATRGRTWWALQSWIQIGPTMTAN